MLKLIFCLLCLSVSVTRLSGCLWCFITPNDCVRLCWGHILIEENVRNIESCMKLLDQMFNFNKTIINAGRVGEEF